MKFYELNLPIEDISEVKGITVEKQENGAYKLNMGLGKESYMSAKKLDSFKWFACNGLWIMAFSENMKVSRAIIYNAFIDAIIENKNQEIGRLQHEYRVKEERIERKIRYFELKKKK